MNNFRPYVCFSNNVFINDDKSEHNMKPCASCLTSFIRTVVSLVSIFFIFNMFKYKNTFLFLTLLGSLFF